MSVTDRDDPKLDPRPASSPALVPDDWGSGDEPMTRAQATCLKLLSQLAHDLRAFDPNLTRAQASKRIDALRVRMDQ